VVIGTHRNLTGLLLLCGCHKQSEVNNTMGSYTVQGAPVKIIIPGPSQKTPVELPKIKLQLNKQQNAMVRLPISTVSVVTSQTRASQQQVQKAQKLQQVQQIQQVNLPQPQQVQKQVQQVNMVQQPQVQPVYLAQQLKRQISEEVQPLNLAQHLRRQISEEQKELQESQGSTEQQIPLEKTVTFADVHCDQYGRFSPIHGSSTGSGRSTPSQTSSGRSSPAQSVYGDQPIAFLKQRRNSETPSPVQMIQEQPTAIVRQRKSSESSSTQDQTSALVSQRRPSITQLIVYQPKQQIVQKEQAHRIRPLNNKRKGSITNSQPSNMQISLPIVLSNQQNMMIVPKKQVEYQQCPLPKGNKAARKNSNPNSNPGKELIIKIVIK